MADRTDSKGETAPQSLEFKVKDENLQKTGLFEPDAKINPKKASNRGFKGFRRVAIPEKPPLKLPDESPRS